ncbi:disease resistance protein RPV1-like isoform X2 [Carya illinoinensis]|uniref:disease resistance protein RPV1-like isoform X2 n=1 Tax=Carya illinoinensis TaxID=32201 RepID=UPI001C718544|nr:disease resistance protein RPV1-like isoform X2 [Carya illinoinensis]
MTSQPALSWVYDVFLSFRGEDVRHNFISHLYDALRRSGINTYIDEQLERGKEISPALLKAIEESRISIIVLSENYASSTWCLEELMKILECREMKQQIVLPVFYKVDPSIVRKQKENYGKALASYKDKLNYDTKVDSWKAALNEVANLSGFHLKKEGNESEFIHSIIQRVDSNIINQTCFEVANHPVGVASRVRRVYSLLSIGENDIVRMVGIFGVGGIGKTTITIEVYNIISSNFEGCCFLKNIRETSKSEYGLVQLQETLLFDILGASSVRNTGHVDRGINVIKNKLRYKRVLLILDDVDDWKQLKALAGNRDWFGKGSRIIITTRDQNLLSNHEVDATYEVEELNHHEALELFSLCAFKRKKPLDNYMELTKRIIRYARGLPLALEVLGLDLRGRSIREWESALEAYKRIPHEKIQKILRTSYDGLSESEKNIFLDIACFFKGENVDYVVKILDGCGFCPNIGIKKLMDKSLITIDGHIKFEMHDLLQDMGREIVREESPKEPGGRSRLWYHEDIRHVLEEDTGTNQIEGILIDLPKEDIICLSSEAFMKMKNLRYFINRNARFSGSPNYLSNKLRVLHWVEYPSQSLPYNFHGRKLVDFRISDSLFKEFGVRFQELNLSGSDIIKLPESMIKFFDLRILELIDCKKLQEIPALPPKIQIVDATGCMSLERFPDGVNLVNFIRSHTRDERWIDLFGGHNIPMNIASFWENPIWWCEEYFRNLSCSVIFPGNRIPDWFSHTKQNSKIWIPYQFDDLEVSSANMNLEWFCDFKRTPSRSSCQIKIWLGSPANIRGVAICVVLKPILEIYPKRGTNLIFKTGYVSRTEVDHKVDLRGSDDRVWLNYTPLHDHLNPFFLVCEVYSIDKPVFFKSCGVHLIFKNEKEGEDHPGFLPLMDGIEVSERSFVDDDRYWESTSCPQRNRRFSALDINFNLGYSNQSAGGTYK